MTDQPPPRLSTLICHMTSEPLRRYAAGLTIAGVELVPGDPAGKALPYPVLIIAALTTVSGPGGLQRVAAWDALPSWTPTQAQVDATVQNIAARIHATLAAVPDGSL